MARINFGEVQESAGGVGGDAPNGTYVMECTGFDYDGASMFATMTWDIAEGEHAGQYADRPDFAHQERLYFDDRALGYLKRKLRVITDSNEKFDAMIAFNCAIDPTDPNHDRAIQAFVGKRFGASLRKYHWPKQGGRDGSVMEVGAWWTAAEAAGGTDEKGRPIPVLADRYKRGYSPAQADAAAEQAAIAASVVAEDDIPF